MNVGNTTWVIFKKYIEYIEYIFLIFERAILTQVYVYIIF